MSNFVFTVSLIGTGDDEEEAWADAVEAFSASPGEPHSTEKIEDKDEDN